ncbi:ATP-binding protein [Trichothermofontia sichuanensis B231]|uniref:sensor histidine kinase n=1 Tax=Trichothermofontia sichuanensis TaxID=3045816 RepID=UPI0022463D99|nr:ATP-binding protein [Trichothermofontia sichuanensis]UZQ54968.1 ATP-binding protein [Trichothermofontia sichuanensis B231]
MIEWHNPVDTQVNQKQLTQITSNIRRTLERETIWRKTVEGIGSVLAVDRCLFCAYPSSNADPTLLIPMQVEVMAEYRQANLPSLMGANLSWLDYPCLPQAITTLKPVVVEQGVLPAGVPVSLLVMATYHQTQPNGLILLVRLLPIAQYESEGKARLSEGDSLRSPSTLSPCQGRLWEQYEIEFVQELAEQVGTAIAHATLFAESQALASELQRVNADLIRQHQALEEARLQAEEARIQAETLSRLKSEFLANTSHELRTPLNGMIGFLKLVLDGMADDPEEQEQFIREAYNSALHLLNVINDILDIAKIEAGKMQLELGPVKLEELFRDVDNKTRLQAEQKHLYFEISLPATRDEIILRGNYQRLFQVMLNLVGNAIKFTHEGGVKIDAEIVKKKIMVHGQELPGYVKVRVADTGIGVSLDQQDKLFQTFSQVDSSRTRQYGGTGLGLAISQKLVEAMGGVVNFYSMGEGLGSTVTFTVPLYQEPVIALGETMKAVDGSAKS